MVQRLKELDDMIKLKISKNYFQVRKAFLALDRDFDGFVTIEDFLHYFGPSENIIYEDLEKLLRDKDRTRKGRLDFTDFTKWFGSSIHMLAGFYFRHDSKKNPQFDANEARFKQRYPERDLRQCK